MQKWCVLMGCAHYYMPVDSWSCKFVCNNYGVTKNTHKVQNMASVVFVMSVLQTIKITKISKYFVYCESNIKPFVTILDMPITA